MRPLKHHLLYNFFGFFNHPSRTTELNFTLLTTFSNAIGIAVGLVVSTVHPVVMFPMILKSEFPRIMGPADITAIAEFVVRHLMDLHMFAHGVQRTKRATAFRAGKRFGVAFLVAVQLDGSVERFRTEGTFIAAVV